MKQTAVEWLETRAEEREKNNPNESAYWHLKQLQKDFDQAKEMEKEQKVYSKEDLFKILLDFVAFPHHDMEPRGSIIERYLNELSKKKLNN
jgi:tRNA(His) 5'-end guanylyltransferase